MSAMCIGTSGWAYKHWKDAFYPRELKPEEYLSFYAKSFDTAEINYSFYKLPSVENYQTWRAETPDDFIFSVKASRYLTHMKKLIDPEEPWQRIKDTAGALKEKLGPILIQFPERWKKNTERLNSFLEMVSSSGGTESVAKFRLAVEFRDESWFCTEVYNILEQYNAALCVADSVKFVRKDRVTADFVYFRYHGREPIYAAEYSSKELRAEAKEILKLKEQGLDVYAYFNNDINAHAIHNALFLKDLVA